MKGMKGLCYFAPDCPQARADGRKYYRYDLLCKQRYDIKIIEPPPVANEPPPPVVNEPPPPGQEPLQLPNDAVKEADSNGVDASQEGGPATESVFQSSSVCTASGIIKPDAMPLQIVNQNGPLRVGFTNSPNLLEQAFDEERSLSKVMLSIKHAFWSCLSDSSPVEARRVLENAFSQYSLMKRFDEILASNNTYYTFRDEGKYRTFMIFGVMIKVGIMKSLNYKGQERAKFEFVLDTVVAMFMSDYIKVVEEWGMKKLKLFASDSYHGAYRYDVFCKKPSDADKPCLVKDSASDDKAQPLSVGVEKSSEKSASADSDIGDEGQNDRSNSSVQGGPAAEKLISNESRDISESLEKTASTPALDKKGASLVSDDHDSPCDKQDTPSPIDKQNIPASDESAAVPNAGFDTGHRRFCI